MTLPESIDISLNPSTRARDDSRSVGIVDSMYVFLFSCLELLVKSVLNGLKARCAPVSNGGFTSPRIKTV